MIKFFSVRSGEVREAETEPMIAAFYNSSDLNPNGLVQDFGWRVHPETLKRLNEIKEDEDKLQKIADRLQIPAENVVDYHILLSISREDDKKNRQKDEQDVKKHQEEYDRLVAESEKEEPKKTSTKAFGKRVASAAEIAAQKKKDDDVLAKLVAADDKKGDN